MYNRPEEVQELLESFEQQTSSASYEVVLVEDGSTLDSELVVARFRESVNISYYQKENTGPGHSRNYGMQRANGNYFIILDSDCVLPPLYIENALAALDKDFVHCFGGPDAALDSFSNVQKAINYVMTSVLTTGGIRGRKSQLGKFQPRSFNMGLSREAFEASKGFGNIHPGEDPQLVMRLWDMGYETRLFPEVFVYHKRRIDWRKFYKQVRKFGFVRPILTQEFPESAKITYWFPTVFVIGVILSFCLALFQIVLPLLIVLSYLLGVFVHALFATKSITIAGQSIYALLIQFIGYGSAFLMSTFFIRILKRNPEKHYPNLYFINE